MWGSTTERRSSSTCTATTTAIPSCSLRSFTCSKKVDLHFSYSNLTHTYNLHLSKTYYHSSGHRVGIDEVVALLRPDFQLRTTNRKVTTLHWTHLPCHLLLHRKPSATRKGRVSTSNLVSHWSLPPRPVTFRHKSWLTGSFKALIYFLSAFEEGGVVEIDFSSVSLVVVSSCEIVVSGFEPSGRVFADFAGYIVGYAGWTMNSCLSERTSLSSLLSCQCPILVCTYSGLSLSALFSRLISLNFLKGLGLPW